jgi:hypothetical protein
LIPTALPASEKSLFRQLEIECFWGRALPTDYKAAAERAIKHLNAFGDTDLFPTLPEMKCYSDHAEEVADAFVSLTVGNYKPSNCIETLTPKTWLGFRIAHQLSASDNIIYLASVIAGGEALENAREPAESMRAVAYRFKSGGAARIFQKGRSFHDWINYLTDYGSSNNPFQNERTVIVTDISDFYQRIYFHRLENVLADAGVDGKSGGFIKKLIQKVRAKQSFGIPVGTSASRLLAESILNDTDRFISAMGYESTRYVDDFRILAASELDAHSAICRLAEHLMVTEGLSLNVAKTKFQTVSELHNSARKRLQDVFTSKEMLELEAYIRLNYGEDEIDHDDEDDNKEEDAADPLFMTSDQLMDRLSDLNDKKGVDLSIFKAILRALRFMPNVNISRLLEEQSELLYYLPREYCLLIQTASKEWQGNIEAVKVKLLSLLNMPPFADLVYVRSWILELFARGTVPCSGADFHQYDFSRSTNEKRYEFLLRGRFDDKAFFRSKRARFSEFSDWEKPALLLGAMCLPADEYKTWVDAVVDEIPGPFSKIFAAWLKANHGDVGAVLAPEA